MLNVNSIDTTFKQINHPLHSRDMTGKRCLVCGNTYKNDPSISLIYERPSKASDLAEGVWPEGR